MARPQFDTPLVDTCFAMVPWPNLRNSWVSTNFGVLCSMLLCLGDLVVPLLVLLSNVVNSDSRLFAPSNFTFTMDLVVFT